MNKKSTLYTHVFYPHRPVNVNRQHKAKQKGRGLNTAIAVFLTKHVGSMPTAYLFALLAITGLLAILGVLSPLVELLVAWVSQTFIQLVLLPVIMVGQNVLSEHSEMIAEEDFEVTQKSYHDLAQIAQHLDAQDAAIIDILHRLETMTKALHMQIEE